MLLLPRLLTLLLALAVSLPLAIARPPAAPAAAGAAPDTAVFGLHAGLPALPGGAPPLSEARALAADVVALPVAPGAAPLYRLRLAPGAALEAAVALLRADPAVAFAEADQLAVATAAPSDPGYAQQWGLATIGAEAAWDVTMGSPETVVAVIDSGLDLDHPDLAGRLWSNPGEIPGNGQDDDNNGFVDDRHGWNFLAASADLSDTNGHGTQVAGVIAATVNNGQGVAGLCGGCSLMVLKVLRADGTANYSDIAAAIGYAAQKGADVINLSLGGASDSAALRAAVAAAAPTAVLVAGAGNNNSSAPFYPAAYDEHVLAVTATGPSDAKVAGANYGPWVDVAAPGEQIYTTYDGGDYGDSSGTSLGAPFASGLAGLLVSARPGWSPADVRAQVIRTASDIAAANPGLAGQLGRGRISAGAALTAPSAPDLQVASIVVDGQPGGRPEPGAEAQLLVTLTNGWATLADAQGTLSGAGVTQGSAAFGAVPALGRATASQAFRVSVPGGAGYNAPLHYTLHVTGAGGFSAELPVAITTAPGITNVGATITTQTWTADRVYKVNGEVGIPEGQTLTIQPGTVVRFAEGARLLVEGALIADGAAERPIVFNSQEPGKRWAGIVFENSSMDASLDGAWAYQGGSIVRHAVVENGGIQLNQAAPYIANSTFQHSAQLATDSAMMLYYAINGTTGAPLAITGNRFEGHTVYLSYQGGSGGWFTDNTLVNGAATLSGGADTPLTISGNRLTTSSGITGFGLNATGALTVTGNLLRGGAISLQNTGTMAMSSVLARGNLVVGSSEPGIRVQLIGYTTPGASFVIEDNTLIDNAEAGITIDTFMGGGSPTPLTIRRNNLIPAKNGLSLRLTDNATFPVDATGNYWGTTDPAVIEQRIHHKQDTYRLGLVSFDPFLTAPAAAAPAYVERVTIGPDTTLGIQTGSFDVRFSRPMNTATTPELRFFDARRGTTERLQLPTIAPSFGSMATDSRGLIWGLGYGRLFSYDGSELKEHEIVNPQQDMGEWPLSMDIGADDTIWVTTGLSLLRYDSEEWTRFPRCAGLAPCTHLNGGQMKVAPDGAVWMASTGMSSQDPPITLLRFADGAWTSYSPSGISFDFNPRVSSLLFDRDGALWVGLGIPAGSTSILNALRFADGSWTSHSIPQLSANDTDRSVLGMSLDSKGEIWARFIRGVARYDGATWHTYPMPQMWPGGWGGLAIDREDVKWLVTGTGLASFDGNEWRRHGGNTSTGASSQLIIDANGHKWYSSSDPVYNGLIVFRDGYDTAVPAGQWLDERTYRASVDITSLVERGAKRLEVTGAADSSGMPAADDSGATFTVDYAGQVSDRTPPPAPYAFASGVSGDAARVTIQYAVADAESSVDRVRYAIGSGPEGGDIVSWTELEERAGAQVLASLTAVRAIERGGLGLTAGRTYYVSLQARNIGGLWSSLAVSPFIAGEVTNPRGYITALGPERGRVGAGVVLTISGYGFMPESLVLWNGQPRETTYVSPSELRATIPAGDLAAAGKAEVSVRNPAPGGGDAAPAAFTISDSRVGGRYLLSLPLIR